MSSTEQHSAAILPRKKAHFVVQQRDTPLPGPAELLLEVKAIALNPIDYMQQKYGFPSLHYPAIVGSDVAGTVLAAGSAVTADAPKPGTRVAAYAPSFFKRGALDYGALQTRVLVPVQNVVSLPAGISFNQASMLPMAVQTAWSGYRQLGLGRDTAYSAADKQGMLVWGAAGSVGSAALQIAKILGFTVYATARRQHHAYLQSLGAQRLFDYQDQDVVARLVQAAKDDGVRVSRGYLAVGALSPCVAVLQQLKGDAKASLVVAPFQLGLLWWRLFPNWRNTSVQFVTAPRDAAERDAFFHFVFGTFLQAKLATGEFVPSPKVQVVAGGLAAAEQALGAFKQGLSGVKLILEV